jgi:hypothetical protein
LLLLLLLLRSSGRFDSIQRRTRDVLVRRPFREWISLAAHTVMVCDSQCLN